MDSIQEAMEKVIFEGEDFATPIPYSIMYMPWEANEVMLSTYSSKQGRRYIR